MGRGRIKIWRDSKDHLKKYYNHKWQSSRGTTLFWWNYLAYRSTYLHKRHLYAPPKFVFINDTNKFLNLKLPLVIQEFYPKMIAKKLVSIVPIAKSESNEIYFKKLNQ